MPDDHRGGEQGTGKPLAYQSLCYIRQTGIARDWDGTTTYHFVAQVQKRLDPITISLTVTADRSVYVTAAFDARMREGAKECFEVLDTLARKAPEAWKEGA